MASKLKTLNEKHGPFDLVLCCGDFFGPGYDEEVECLRNDTLELPMPVYFITGDSQVPSDLHEASRSKHGEICSNLVYLGRSGEFTTTEGLKIAFLSGTHHSPDKKTDYYNKKHVDALANMKHSGHSKGADILLTYEWPMGIYNGSSQVNAQSSESFSASKLCNSLSPRYHFGGQNNTFFEREPFKNEENCATRFIGLAALGNAHKQRWFYAANIFPVNTMDRDTLLVLPKNVTENPFIQYNIATKRKPETSHTHEDSKKHRKSGKNQPCWFCLSNPDITQHLITSIGDEVLFRKEDLLLTTY